MAVRLGAEPIANARAIEALDRLRNLLKGEPAAPAVEWLTVSGTMGEDALRASGFSALKRVHTAPLQPSANDTQTAMRQFMADDIDLVLFCGGDGTARDICTITGESIPLLGIPSGVKMYSGVFAITPARAADILLRYLKQEIGLSSVEILDLDEDKYRRDEWTIRLYMSARAPFEPAHVQTAKAIITDVDEDAVKEDIPEHLREDIEENPEALFLLGPGSTVQAVGRALKVEKTLLGIDAIAHGQITGKDLTERQILALLARYGDRRLILSPIGAQGFVLGRGNQQLSPAVIRSIGVKNLVLIATPAKLARTPLLRFDTGDSVLDADLTSRKFLPVIIGYHRLRLVETAS